MVHIFRCELPFDFEDQTVHRPEHDDEDRHLCEEWETGCQRVDLVLLVQLHHLGVQLLTVALELRLQSAHLGLQALHLEHALRALQCEGSDEEHHDDGNETDRDCITVCPGIKRGNQASSKFKHVGQQLSGVESEVSMTVREDRRVSRISGTGSNPEGPKGRHRLRRRTVSTSPRHGPCVEIASEAYSEHVGKNRQGEGAPGRSD